MRHARGQYLFFLDGDDKLAPDALAKLYATATCHNADLVIGQTVRWDGDRTWPIPQYVKHGIAAPGPKHLTTHPGLLYAMAAAKLYRRDLLNGVFFPEHLRLGEDQSFVLQAYLRASLIYIIDATVYYYRVSSTSQPSLTGRALLNPTERLGDLYEMVAMAQTILANQPRLFAFYLNRVLIADLLPRFRAAIYGGHPAIQRTALQSLTAWLQTLDTQLFKTVPGLRSHLRLNVLLCKRKIQPEAAPAFREFERLVRTHTSPFALVETVPLLTGAVLRRLKR